MISHIEIRDLAIIKEISADFFPGLNMVERWSGLFGSDNEGEWQNDRELFEKYHA